MKGWQGGARDPVWGTQVAGWDPARRPEGFEQSRQETGAEQRVRQGFPWWVVSVL